MLDWRNTGLQKFVNKVIKKLKECSDDFDMDGSLSMVYIGNYCTFFSFQSDKMREFYSKKHKIVKHRRLCTQFKNFSE